MVAFVGVLSFVHNNRAGTFVSGFDNYIFSVFKLANSLSFCNSKVIIISVGFTRGYVKFITASKKVFRAPFSVFGRVPSSLVMEKSVVFVG